MDKIVKPTDPNLFGSLTRTNFSNPNRSKKNQKSSQPDPTPPTSIKPSPPAVAVAEEEAFRRRKPRTEHFSPALPPLMFGDARLFPVLLKSCAAAGDLRRAVLLHQQAVVHGHSAYVHIASSLIHMYGKCGACGHARRLFDEMPEKNVVPWTAIINSYFHNGDIVSAFHMYNMMRKHGVEANSVTVLSLVSGAVEVVGLQCVHACVVKSGFEYFLKVGNCVLNVYGRCGEVELARRLFDGMIELDVVSWNSLISAYAKNGWLDEGVMLFNRMKVEGTEPDHQTFASLAAAVVEETDIDVGRCIHAQIITTGYESDAHIQTALIGMYLKCQATKHAVDLFMRLKERDVISWTTIIAGLVQNQHADQALVVFGQMLTSKVVPSSSTIASALAACAQLVSITLGASIHGYVIRRLELDTAAQNSLLTMYAKCGHIRQCELLFNAMECKDLVSWNSLIAGYTQNGHVMEAFMLLKDMTLQGERPDYITVVSLLQACASLGLLHQGKWVHNFILRNGVRSSSMVVTALIDMYSKCGEMESAEKCFNQLSSPDLVTWSAIISAYGNHGKGEIALVFYDQFLQTRIRPNQIIFLSVLSACSHSGLVSEGLSVFNSMTSEFAIPPNQEHIACIVDLLCRSGRLQEAHNLFRSCKVLPKPNADVLGIILDACRIQKNAELGEIVAGEIMAQKPVSAGNYVQLAQSYASVNKWDAVSHAWLQMRLLGLRKTPGWSSIELKGQVTIFFADHNSHSQLHNILSTLKILEFEMKNVNGGTNPCYCI